MPIDLSKAQIKAIEEATKLIRSTTGVYKNNDRIKAFVKERKMIDDFTAKKNPLIKEYVNLHKEAEKRPYTKIGRMVKEMKEIAGKQEILKAAAAMCKDADDKQELMQMHEELNREPAMVAYEKYMDGLRYLAGMTNELKPDVKEFFANELREVLPDDKSDIFERYRGSEESWEVSEQDKEEANNLSDYTKKLNAQYQKMVAPAKAREMFAKSQVDTDALEAQFVGAGTIKSLEADSAFRKRMAPSAFFIGRMLSQGYSIGRILDPRDLLEEKKKVGQEYLEHRKNKDYTWYVETIYKDSEHMINAFQEYVEKYKNELKTEQDLVMHSNTLGMLAYCCFDHVQELQMTRHHAKNISEKAVKERESELGKYMFGVGMGSTGKITYELNDINPVVLGKEVTRQLCIKKMLEEMQKDTPDFSNNMVTLEQWENVERQVGTIDELTNLFDEETMVPDQLSEKDVKVLASMMSFDFVNDNNLRYDRPRVPVSVKTAPDNQVLGMLEKGQKLDRVVSRNDKQVVSTDKVARMDLSLKSVEKKNLRGRVGGNSKEFDEMMKAFDKTAEKLGKDEVPNAECRAEMAKLKEAATKYIIAKREQKGYYENSIPNRHLDAIMLGREHGDSIFTSKGKDRYEFALNAIDKINEFEQTIKEYESQKTEMTQEDPEVHESMEI